MGVCASCLGQNRHSSQDDDGDLNRILDTQQPSYGTISDLSVTQPDEEELRREREALEQITTQAADHMIDVLHPDHAEVDQAMNSHKKHVEDNSVGSTAGAEDEDAEERAWLESVQSASLDIVRVPQKGTLVMDVNLLRDGTQPKIG